MRRLPAVLSLLLLAAPARAQVPSRHPVTVTAHADVALVHPGETFHVAVVFRIDPGWHTYWINPGDTGMPTEVRLKTPRGFTAAAPLFPRPRPFKEPDGTTFGYALETVIFVPVTAPATLGDETVALTIDASWLVCRGLCMLGFKTLDLAPLRTTATPGPRVPADLGADAARVERFRGRLPRALDEKSALTCRYENGRLLVSGPADRPGPATLFPIESRGILFGVPRAREEDGRFVIEVEVDIRPDPARDGPPRLRGIVAPGRKPDDPCWTFDLQVEEAAS